MVEATKQKAEKQVSGSDLYHV
jgi:glycyl-tRNA synthetase